MKTTNITSALIAASAAAAIGLAAAPAAVADDDVAATTATIGQQATLNNGDVTQGWTISGLRPSTDAIPYTPQGTLWEATATNEAIQGSVQPIVSNLNARAADGQNYRVLFGVATPQGVNPAALAQGEKTSGKIYFDVTGAVPDTVVYNSGGHDLLVWKPAPPAPRATSGSGSTWTAPAQSAPAATTPVAPAATGSSGTPIAEGTTAAPAAAGSSGTPVTEGTPATPAPAAAGSSGTPVTEGTPATPAPGAAGSAGTPATPAPAAAGSSGTPAVAPAQAPAAGSAGTPALVDGSTGTPAVQSVPTTTVVGIPHGMGSSGTPAS